MSNWRTTEGYQKMLVLMGSLSKLYSDSIIPFIYYRVTENLFCKYCDAKNLARDDSAYDARIGNVGIGIKTFQVRGGRSTEKIAEFDKLSTQLRNLHNMDLAMKLAEFRNARMQSANNLYGIDQSVYHIIGRSVGRLEIFDSPYDFVDVDSLKIIEETDKALRFKDRNHSYTFNRSKSVLMKQFVVPENRIVLPIEIIDDPYTLLEKMLTGDVIQQEQKDVKGKDYVILPLYSLKGKKGNKQKVVPECSGLNQWNAEGRQRDYDEVYIPVPSSIHKKYPDFFPNRDTSFTLHLPDDTNTLSAKMCQQGNKALMSNPNKALGEWILRKVLQLKQGDLLTYDRLLKAGFDSLKITRIDSENYYVDISNESYSDTESEEENSEGTMD